MQLVGGYILDGIEELLIRSEYDNGRIKSLLNYLGYFDVDINTHLVKRAARPEFCVLHNFIQRGIPTYLSIEILDLFLATFKFLKKNADELGSISVDFNGEPTNLPELIFRSLHIVDPKIEVQTKSYFYKRSWENLGSRYEEDFYFNVLANCIHPSIFQVIETQRELESVLHFSADMSEEYQKFLEGAIESFAEQHVDFSLELPYKDDEKKGLIIEIDGPQHQQQNQRKLDEMRDNAVLKAGWNRTLRINTEDFNHINALINPLTEFVDNDYINIVKENFDNPIIDSKAGQIALQLSLSPFAIARIQKVLIELLLSGYLSLDEKIWKIIVLERDVPCAGCAIKDFMSLIAKLFQIQGIQLMVPEVELTIISEMEVEWELNRPYQSNIKKLNNLSKEKFDLFIDISVLRRSQILESQVNIDSKIHAKVRSSFSPRVHRTFISADLIKYTSFIDVGQKNINLYNNDVIDPLTYFLQTTFRKKEFREGQLEILNKTMSLNNVVGLLPTGSGKSLTYQLSVLLQPGFALIVDPIKSLMKDQYEGLIAARIDCVNYINSSIKSAWLRKKYMQKMALGQVLFTFISPERFQIRAFREFLLEMTESNSNYFSYCVIDEAHCVSEWGHDFRTAYLKLGENARKFCKIKGAVKENENDEYHPAVTLIGLTATASFDVLSDVQRELDLSDESIIKLSSLKRPELKYIVEKVNVRNDRYLNRWDQLEVLGTAKQKRLAELLNLLPATYIQFNNQFIDEPSYYEGITAINFHNREGKQKACGLVFCPHRTWYFGVDQVYIHLKQNLPNLNFGTFVGSSGNDDNTQIDQDNISEINQDKFKFNELNVLVATKAFGMGIDKPNIRYTVHFNFPSSIESFYQEAGRAGRDRKLALCYVLFSGHEHDKEILLKFHQNSFKGIEKEIAAIDELLTEITFPSVIMSNEITDAISEELNINIYLSFWPKDNPRRLYVNESYNRGYGYIDLTNENIITDDRNFTFENSRRILENIANYIDDHKRPEQNYYDFLNERVEDHPAPGIEEILDSIDENEQSVPVIIGFTNDKIRKISDFLKDHVDTGFTQKIVELAQAYCFSSDEFIKNLRSKFHSATGRWININDDVGDIVSELFTQIRSEQDTYRAIYRLSILGVIDDYEVDYSLKNITVIISRKDDGQYLDKLYEYLKRYVSEERARLVYDEIDGYEGTTIIRRCSNYLVNFVYGEIANKRKGAIDAMEEACRIGADDNELFEEYIEIYFDSKYYPDLVIDTEEGRFFDFDIVWKYIELVKGNVDNIKHLRGASTRLLTDNPDNGALLLLRAFSIILIESSNERFYNEGRSLIVSSLSKFRDIKREPIPELLKDINKYISLLENEEATAGQAGEDAKRLFFGNHFINWFVSFNILFLEDYA